MNRFKFFLNSHRRAMRKGVGHFIHTPWLSLLTILTLGVSLAMPIGLYSFFNNIKALSGQWQQGYTMTLYLKSASEAARQDLLATLANKPFVQQLTYISPEEGLNQFAEQSHLADLLNVLPENPLPAAVIIQLPQESDLTRIEEWQQELAQLPLVEKANFDQAWYQQLQALLQLLYKMVILVYAIVSMGGILIIGNTLRLSLERHRQELEVLALIGATKAYMGRPFIYRGIGYGLLGGLIALAIVGLITLFLSSPTEKVASFYDTVFSLHTLSLPTSAIILLGTSLLGLIGAKMAFWLQYQALIARE